MRILICGLIGFLEYILLYYIYTSKQVFLWTTAFIILLSGIFTGFILTAFKFKSPLALTILTPLMAMPISAVIMVAYNGYSFGFKDVWATFFGTLLAQNLMFFMAPLISIPVFIVAYLAFHLINKVAI